MTILGMDFGTTNTGAAVYDGQAMHALPLDPAASAPTICRTAIYMTRAGEFYLGSAALNNYFQQNVGRPTRYHKVWVGEIIQVFANLPVFYRDVYVYEDEFSPGRLFTSIKTVLRNREYYGTVFQGAWYSASDLVAVFLSGMKLRIEASLGHPVDEVVLGRPVHFSLKPEEDQVAQARLLDAAFKAGFRKVYLEYEPVAAALAYARTLNEPETVLVFDFGGGTLDFTVMQIGGPEAGRVLATGGVPIAGDIFDQRLFRATIPKHLGEGDSFLQNARRYPIPAHIFDALSQPSEILSLNTPENLEMLRQMHAGAANKQKTAALLKVVSSNYALLLFDLVERAKRQLSEQAEALIQVEHADLAITEPVTRLRFEKAIAQEVAQIRQELFATVERSGLRPEQIQRVIRTGGSSQIPLFVRMLNEIFGRNKVQAIDVFSSVTAGLAVRGRQIEVGQAHLLAYLAAPGGVASERTTGTQVESEARPVDLRAVQARLSIQSEDQPAEALPPGKVLLVASQDGLWVLPVDEEAGRVPGLQRLAKQGLSGACFCLAGLAAEVLLATNQHKLLSLPVTQLYQAQQVNLDKPAQGLPLVAQEMISALLVWLPETPRQALLGMVTQHGQGRVFEARLLAEYIQRRPFFQLEQRYLGAPLALFALRTSDSILFGSNLGRVARALPGELSLQPVRTLHLREDEQLTAVGVAPQVSKVLGINPQGRLLHLEMGNLPTSGSPAARSRTVRRGFVFTAFLLPGSDALLLTSEGRLIHNPFRDSAITSTGAVKLDRQEYLLASPYSSD